MHVPNCGAQVLVLMAAAAGAVLCVIVFRDRLISYTLYLNYVHVYVSYVAITYLYVLYILYMCGIDI